MRLLEYPLNNFFNSFIFTVIFCAFPLSNQMLFSQTVEKNHFSEEEIIELEGKTFNYFRSGFKLDNNGNIIVADMHTGRILIFEPSGEYIKGMGGLGRGPGEFTNLLFARQLTNGNYIGSCLSGRMAMFNSDGVELQTYQVPVGPIVRFVELNESEILIPGRYRGGDNTKLLHVLDLESGDIVRSMLDAPFKMEDYGGILGSLGTYAKAETDGTYIYAMLTFLNEMFVLDLDGKIKRNVKIDFEHFRPLEKQDGTLSREEFEEVLTSFDTVVDLIWKDENTLIVSYWWEDEVDMNQALTGDVVEGFNGFAEIDLYGNVIYEAERSPSIFDYVRGENTYYTKDGGSLNSESQRILKLTK